MTHKKTINIIGDIISQYNKAEGEYIKKSIDWAREYREIFSYKFPANGLTNHHLHFEDVIKICKILCEIAQLQSKILENSFTKNVNEEFDLDENILSVGYSYGEYNFSFIDNEDGYRLDYITRKQRRPYALNLTMTEGMVEDFFGAWIASENEDEIEGNVFDPDSDWQIIFPVS